MKSTNRDALGICAATALLTGCVDSQLPMGAHSAGGTAQPASHERTAIASWSRVVAAVAEATAIFGSWRGWMADRWNQRAS
jgi:hypothetical protein